MPSHSKNGLSPARPAAGFSGAPAAFDRFPDSVI
jgi:hypothetical protein